MNIMETAGSSPTRAKMNRVNTYLVELAATKKPMLLEELWGAIEESVKSQQWEATATMLSQVYQYPSLSKKDR
eukprot:CAMPEP_0113952708 /NCGR_PEP_ID=MMETSP1339-20121228/90570_1 /TAXON_ID=94617 /ORGANISM="Fibrocapsa japonica" /LENGTH=72 /DNA_ID=CAMNT_0000961365 /DNA_START=311 /DNA_END=532 /DNA_ORIENTATION=+ /assembly_acc=CAM_ASM_000762